MTDEIKNRFRQYKDNLKRAENLKSEIQRLESIDEFISVDASPKICTLRKTLEDLQDYNLKTLEMFSWISDPEASEVIRLVYVEGLTISAAGSILYMSPKTVYRRCDQGFSDILQKLGE